MARRIQESTVSTSTLDDEYTEGVPSLEGIEVTPKLGAFGDKFIDFCIRVESRVNGLAGEERIVATNQFRNDLVQNPLVTEEELAFLFAKSVMLDLVAQGWSLSVRKPDIVIFPPSLENENRDVVKEFIRNTHLLGRDSQLREKSVQEFIEAMQRRRLSPKGAWHSIYSLMRDGSELAQRLHTVEQIADPNEKLNSLSKTISPYLQFVEPGKVCEETGLRLGDIWRYFRHTWVNEYKSTPGRSIMILIRDAAATSHPVIGIASLGSSVVQHKLRDKWIGWHPELLVAEITADPTPEVARWLLASVERLIADIFREDLLEEGILKQTDELYPTDKIVKRLFDESELCIKQHRKTPQRTKHNPQKRDVASTDFWEKEARTFLYRSKRCKQLAKLFHIRRTFQEHGFDPHLKCDLQKSFQTSRMRSAIQQLVRMIKAEHVGVDMLDITVCGAVAPYNSLIGGKLVALLLCSPEVTRYYTQRYKKQTSIIASGMKGKAVVRKPRLVLLCTTSLYGVGSSQYNRVKIPLKEIGFDSDEHVAYEDIGHSSGFGTYHFSRVTIQLGSNLNSRRRNGRHVNSIFGEGVNPLMRKIRESLDSIGLNSDGLLQHGNKRVTYGIQLARNFREVLLGRQTVPNYLIPQAGNGEEITNRIADYWRRRWLLRRISRPEILEAVSQHISSSLPPSHGAVVPLEVKDKTDEVDFGC